LASAVSGSDIIDALVLAMLASNCFSTGTLPAANGVKPMLASNIASRDSRRFIMLPPTL
jgi:hypothetical protein